MTTVSAEQREILASFAAEIQPQLATVAWSLQQLSERPGDQLITEGALADLQTLGAVVGILELDRLEAFLATTREVVQSLGRIACLSAEEQAAVGSLAALISRCGRTLAEGDISESIADEASALAGVLRSAAGTSSESSVSLESDLDDLLDTLDLNIEGSSPPTAVDSVWPSAITGMDMSGAPVEFSASADGATEALHDAAMADLLSKLEADEPTVELGSGLDALLATLNDTPPSIAEPEIAGAGVPAAAPWQRSQAETAGEPALPGSSEAIAGLPDNNLDMDEAIRDAGAPVDTAATGRSPEGDWRVDEVGYRPPAVEDTGFEEKLGDPSAILPEVAGLESVESAYQQLVARLGETAEQLRQSESADGLLLSLMEEARAAQGVAGAAARTGVMEAASLVERVAELLIDGAVPESNQAIPFLLTAQEVLGTLVFDESAASEMIGLLSAQLAGLQGEGNPEDVSGGAAGWGDLPPEVLREIEGVDIEDLDEEALRRLASMLDAHDAARESNPVPFAAEPEADVADHTDGENVAGEEPLRWFESPLEPVLPARASLSGHIESDVKAEDSDSLSWALAADLETAAPVTESFSVAADDDGFEDEIRAVFLAEAEEHIAAINESLLKLDARPSDSAPLIEVRRAVHTLKGASGAVGLSAVSDFCHVWEDALDAVEHDGVNSPEASLMLECAEALERYLRQPDGLTANLEFAPLITRLKAVVPPSRPEHTGWRVEPSLPAETGTTRDQDSVEAPVESPSNPAELVFLPSALAGNDVASATQTPTAQIEQAEPNVTGEAPITAADMLRVASARVDAMVGLVGELVVQRSGIVERLERLGSGIEELESPLARLGRIGAELDSRFGYTEDLGLSRLDTLITSSAAEFDELEFDRYGEAYQLSRVLLELAADLGTTRRELGQLLEDVQLGLVRQGRTTNDLHDQLLAVRLVPLATLTARLQRTVRQASLHSGKQISFVLEGGQTQMDKSLLEEIADPLLHLLRNAVDHGIESEAVRVAAGKPAQGTVRVSGRRIGNEVVIEVADDGTGIDPVQVLARGRERGFVDTDADDDQALAHELIFAPGFSTAASVTGLSGRGIGLDVVRAHLVRAKGMVTVSSTPGRGTTFTLRVPALMVVTPSLVVQAATQTVALPLAQVRRVMRISTDELVRVGDAMLLRLDDATVPVRNLSAALSEGYQEDELPPTVLVVVVLVGDRSVPVIVDDILGQQEAVVSPPAPPFDVLPGLAGTTILGNGDVLLVLNVMELFGEAVELPQRIGKPPTTRAERSTRVPTVLVVDDSLSVRRVVSRALTKHGWQVHEARDGVQAMEMMPSVEPDVILLDVEMPRMDGYEVTSALKRQPEYQHIPIVMLTSRGGERHQRKAAALGVDAYLVKPYQETVLLRLLREIALAAPQGEE